VCSSLGTIAAHNTAQNRLDNFPSCPPDNHHCSVDVYLREIEALSLQLVHLLLAGSDCVIEISTLPSDVWLMTVTWFFYSLVEPFRCVFSIFYLLVFILLIIGLLFIYMLTCRHKML